MKKLMVIVSCIAVAAVMTSCLNHTERDQMRMFNAPFNQERDFITDAMKHQSPVVQRVDLIGNTVVYTHIFDGIIDMKTYTYEGNVCVEAERVYTFPSQMSALRHYRRAIEQIELYDDIKLYNNEVRYNLKSDQLKLETKGLTKEQLMAKFEQQIQDAKADLNCCHDKDKCKK